MSSWCPVTHRTCERTTCIGSVCQGQQEMSAQSASLLQQGILDGREGRISPVPDSIAKPAQPDRLREAANTIRAALKEDTVLYKHYLSHAAKMLEQEDLHGLWDAAMNASEVSNRLDAYQATLEAMGVSE